MIIVTSSFSLRPHENAKPAFSISSGLKSVFRSGLVWTIGITVEIKLPFHILRGSEDVV